MPNRPNFTELIDKYIQGKLSAPEKEIFFQLFESDDLDPLLEEYLWENYQQSSSADVWPDEFRNKFSEKIGIKILTHAGQEENIIIPLQDSNDTSKNVNIRPAPRVHFIRRWWWAAAILIIGITLAGVLSSDQQQNPSQKDVNLSASPEIAPGGERAMLTLADGRTIKLDNAANGQLADQGGVKIIKLANGQITYDLRGLSSEVVMWNTMSTPKGGQYQVTLPDGTKVWLNASSSITFPTAFIANKRQVKIQGEVYFEVEKNKQKPFIVEIDGKSLIEVLGTSFNVNSYTDEGNITTTLVDGSVKVITPSESVILKPGQQAKVTEKQIAIAIATNVDLDKALDWRNGIFNFNGADLQTVMRQLERWYDIKVQYKGSESKIVFKGKMYRNVSFSDVLDILKKMGVRYQLEGKVLIVL